MNGGSFQLGDIHDLKNQLGLSSMKWLKLIQCATHQIRREKKISIKGHGRKKTVTKTRLKCRTDKEAVTNYEENLTAR